jgi:hypothetical protein
MSHIEFVYKIGMEDSKRVTLHKLFIKNSTAEDLLASEYKCIDTDTFLSTQSAVVFCITWTVLLEYRETSLTRRLYVMLEYFSCALQ